MLGGTVENFGRATVAAANRVGGYAFLMGANLGYLPHVANLLRPSLHAREDMQEDQRLTVALQGPAIAAKSTFTMYLMHVLHLASAAFEYCLMLTLTA